MQAADRPAVVCTFLPQRPDRGACATTRALSQPRRHKGVRDRSGMALGQAMRVPASQPFVLPADLPPLLLKKHVPLVPHISPSSPLHPQSAATHLPSTQSPVQLPSTAAHNIFMQSSSARVCTLRALGWWWLGCILRVWGAAPQACCNESTQHPPPFAPPPSTVALDSRVKWEGDVQKNFGANERPPHNFFTKLNFSWQPPAAGGKLQSWLNVSLSMGKPLEWGG